MVVVPTSCLTVGQFCGFAAAAGVIPSGPSTSTVFIGSVRRRVFLSCGGGSRSLSLTSCGSDNWAEPIREQDLGVVVKRLLHPGGDSSAGARKSGNSVVAACS